MSFHEMAARVAGTRTSTVGVNEAELIELDADGIASFAVHGELDGAEFSGVYTQDMTGRDSPLWAHGEGPDPSEDPEEFYSMQRALYETDVFKDAAGRANA